VDPYRQSIVYQFGVFELSARTGELRKSGVILRLPPQPTQLLRLLVSRGGELVSREELRQEVWKGDTIVDFELGLNRCVRRIRAALLDDADAPRYIETVPRMGYRFIAPVKVVQVSAPKLAPGPAPTPAAATPEPPVPASLPLVPEPVPAAPPSPTDWRKATRWSAIALVLMAVALAGLRWTRARQDGELQLNYTAVPFTTEPGVSASPTFSPDGRQIAFAWNGSKQDNFDIYVKSVGSHEVKRLTNSPDIDHSPAWSPDGRSIAFCRGSEREGSSLWLLSLNEGTERKLAELQWNAVPINRLLTWSPDSARLVYAGSATDQKVNGLFELDVASGAITRLTTTLGSDVDLNPAYAPNGRWIAFVRDTARGVSRICLLPVKPAGGVQGAIVELQWPGFESSYAARPVWTPDSSHLAFVSNRNGEQQLWIVRAEPGATPQLLGTLGTALLDAAISTNGELALVREHLDIDIWRLDVNHLRHGEVSAEPMVNSTRLETNPRVSPDGTRIAFESNRSGYMEIWTSNLDGTNLTQVTNIGHPITGSPSWSPDSKRIAFDSRAGGSPRIYVAPASGGKVEAVTSAADKGVVPAWSSSGAWIYFNSDQTGQPEIWRVPSSGGVTQQVTKHGGFAAVGAHNRLWYAADRSRVTSLRELDLETNQETTVATSVIRRAYYPSDDGLYYVTLGQDGRYSLQFLPSNRQPVRTLHQFPHTLSEGLSLSPDGRFLYYGEADKAGSDLLLVQDFWRK
jgi:Tol biopolymer transport system component/DNA-binding winged helix-turn-helix (wHTH) protein